MSCDPVKGCPPNTHNLHCGYPDCEKGRVKKPTPTQSELVAAVLHAVRVLDAIEKTHNPRSHSMRLHNARADLSSKIRAHDAAFPPVSHVCGLMGFDPMRDGECPACAYRRSLYDG